MKTTKLLFGILAITAALIFQTQAQSFLTNGLVAYYPFNGDANDASGNGNNGFVNNVTLGINRFKKADAAIYFSSHSYISTPVFAGAKPTSGTISLWILNGGNQPAGDTGVALWNASSAGNDFALLLSNSIPVIFSQVNYGGEQFEDFGAQPLQSGYFYQLVASWDTNGVTLYINGQSVGFSSNLFQSGSTSPLGFGNFFNMGDYTDFFGGAISDARIYNRSLSSDEVAQLYSIESKAPTIPIDFSSPFLDVTLALNISKQSSSNVVGSISTTASPTLLKSATKNILNMLAFDENLEGNWPSNSFPKNAALALAGNAFIVLNGTNILLNVSDIMSFNTGEPHVISGKQSTVTGLASPSAQKLQIAGIMFDDTFINGGYNLKFYLDGVLGTTTTDTTPVSGVYTETRTLKFTTAAGDGSSQDVPFICTGSFSATGKRSLHQ